MHKEDMGKWVEESKQSLAGLYKRRGQLYEEIELLSHAIIVNERIVSIEEGCECQKEQEK
jgi:hypothetical protein